MALAGTVVSAVGLLIAILMLIFVPIHFPKSSVKAHPDSNYLNLPVKAAGDNLGGATTKPFSWNADDFLHLQMGNENGRGGDSLNAVIHKHGQPDYIGDAHPDDNGVLLKEVSYFEDVSDLREQRRVELEFVKQDDGNYLLRKANEWFLGAENTDISGLENPFSRTNYPLLKVGTYYTGANGTSMNEIFSKFGYPKSLAIQNYHFKNDKKETIKGLEATVNYEDFEAPTNRVVFVFKQNYKLEYHLSQLEVDKE